jgi:hypothetical protein
MTEEPDDYKTFKELWASGFWGRAYVLLQITFIVIAILFLAAFCGVLLWANGKIMQMESYRHQHGHYPGELEGE